MKTIQSIIRHVAADALKPKAGWVAAWLMLGLTFALPAASTDISNMPINSTNVTLASPNIMLLMDTSKSILFTHAPNLLEGAPTPPPPAAQAIGYRANQCNSIYYNPATTYTVPVDSTATPLMNAAQVAVLFSAAPYNFYTPGGTNISAPNGRATVNLNSQFQAFDQNTRQRQSSDANDEEQRAYYYVYTTTAGATPATLAYAAAPCTDAYGTPGSTAIPVANDPANSFGTTATTGGFWKRVLVGPVGTPGVTVDETQNFAIWYTFYRTRVSLTKSGIGLAFSTLGHSGGSDSPLSYRVGFINGNPLTKPGGVVSAAPALPASVDSSMYLPLAQFNPAQKAAWYSMLYAQVPGGSSPMREGLARVGRHYANKNDGINNNMTLQSSADDQSCRQNFTIMTTGGYWSRFAETAGPVKIDGSTPVGEEDGVADATVTVNGTTYLISPRPLWDGGTTGNVTTTDKWNTYSAASCVTGSVVRSTVQNLVSTAGLQQTVYPATTQSTSQLNITTTAVTQNTSQQTQSTAQITQSTAQINQNTSQLNLSTSQINASTSQVTSSIPTLSTSQLNITTTAVTSSTSQLTQSSSQLTQSTSQLNLSTTQATASTSQLTMSTSQITSNTPTQSTSQLNITTTAVTQSTSQLTRSTSQVQQSTSQVKQSTSQLTASTSQLTQSTSQLTQSTPTSSTSQLNLSTSQVTASTSQLTASTSQLTLSTSQLNQSTSQITAGTSQLTQSTSQLNQSTSQLNQSTSQITASTSQPMQTTTVSTMSTSQWWATDSQTSTPVATCTSTAEITCYDQLSGPTPVVPGSCVAQAASSTNSYTATTCTNPTPVTVAVAVCTPQTAAYGYVQITCTFNTTPATGVASCTPGTNASFITTTCSTVTTGPTPVASCTVASATAGNSYTATTCPTVTTGPTGVASCTAASANSGNSYTTTTCATTTTGPTGVASCTPGTSGTFLVTTCNTVTSGPTGVASCTPASANSGNSYVATTCNTVTTGPTPVATCAASSANSGNLYTTTTCPTVTTGPTGVASCTPIPAASGNSYTATTCNTVTSGPTGVASCTPGTSGTFVVTTCNTVTAGPTGVASCTPASAGSGNSYTTTTCNTVTAGPTPTGSCTPASANSGNSYTVTTCPVVTTGPTAAPSGCTPVPASLGTTWTATTCGWTTPVGVASCTASAVVVCNTVVSGPTGVAACTPALAGSGNSYIAVTCNTVTTGPTGVASCTGAVAGSSNSYTSTTCNTVNTGPTGVASCTAALAASGNSYVATSCNTINTGPTGVAACTPGTDANFLVTTCNTVTTGPTGVAACTPGTDANFLVTTCNTVNTGPTGVASCTAAPAGSGNSYTATTCGSTVVGPTPTGSCTPAAATSTNSWVATTCPVVTTGPIGVSSCTPVPASATTTPPWTATTCGWTAPTGSAVCVPSGTQLCNTVSTGPTPVASCTPAAARALNNYIETTCNTVTTGPTPMQICIPPAWAPYAAIAGVAYTYNTWLAPGKPYANQYLPQPGTAVYPAANWFLQNNYTATTCATVNTGPTPVAACANAAASSTNSWTASTCTTATTGPTGVASCTATPADSTNAYTATTCNTVNLGPTGVASCTPQTAGSGNSYIDITCNTVNTGPTGVTACSPITAAAGNQYTATSCNTTVNGPTPTGSCTAAVASSTNSWIATACTTATSGPTNAPLGCTPVTASATTTPPWTATTCGWTAPAGVASCVPSATQICNTVLTGPTPTGSCTTAAASGTNSWTATTCGTTTTGPTPTGSCSAAAASGANSWTATTCNTATTGPTPAASCTPVTASASTTPPWTATTCSTVNTGPTGVASCTAIPADSTNTYTATSCGTAVTGPTGVSSCTPIAAASGNSWVATSCNTVTTSASVASCTPVTASASTLPAWTATTCNTVTNGPTPTGSCTAAPAIAGNSYIATTCSTATSGPTNVASCTPITAAAGTTPAWTATTCNTPLPVNTWVASCTPVTGSATSSPTWTTTTCTPVATGPTPVASCTPIPAGPSTTPPWTATSCSTVVNGSGVVGVVPTSACTPGMDANFVQTTCVPVPGEKVQYTTTTSTSVQTVSGGASEGAPVVSVSTAAATDMDGVCYSQAQQPVLFATTPAFSAGGAPAAGGTPAPGRPPAIPSTVPTTLTSVGPAPTAPCTAWPCSVGGGSTAGGSTNSLADVAQYYYVTDLRPDLPDNVFVGPASGFPNEDDRLKSQHMTTFVVGLGVSGTLSFTTDYPTGTGDFTALRTGTAVAGQGSGATSWPVWPTATTTSESQFNDPRSIDDFWHTAVDGRGRFFSAKDPASLVSGISGALQGIASASGTGSGVTLASPVLPTSGGSAGTTSVFTTSFVTGKWTGDVKANTFSASGVSSSLVWSAQADLSSMVSNYCDGRNIWVIRTGGTAVNNLAPFTWNTQTCDGSGNPTGGASTGLTTELAYFGVPQVTALSQFSIASTFTAAQFAAAEGTAPAPNGAANLVNYLRGQKGYQSDTAIAANQLFRARDSALGDIVDSQVAYVPAPAQLYGDAGYASFVSANAARPAMTYVGANDGMLHAFNASTGVEAWAVIPASVLPNLFALADFAYGSAHQFYVDGSPIAGDIYTGSAWKTILVGGLNAGGAGYYALDVTDPTTPKALWEFKASSTNCPGSDSGAVGNSGDCNLGLSFGRPVITKLSNGTWVVLVTSGYNNTTGGGNGQGYLYVLNAATGQIIQRIGTGVGDTGAVTGPSGLRELTTYVSNPLQNNTSLWVYGGDLLGNLWRFDINSTTSVPAVLVTTLTDASGIAQSITTPINLAEENGNTFLIVGTGRLLGASDVANTQEQTVYSIMDPMGTPAPTTPPTAELPAAGLRGSLKPVLLTTTGSLSAGNFSRTALPCTGTQCSAAAGWYMDLTAGLSDSTQGSERITFGMVLVSGTLVFESNIPSTTQCASGYNLFNAVDFVNGGAVGNSVVTSMMSSTLASGGSLVGIGGSGSSPIPEYCVTMADGTVVCKPPPLSVSGPVGKRISWREIAQ